MRENPLTYMKYDDLIKYIAHYIPSDKVAEQLVTILETSQQMAEYLLEPDSYAAEFILDKYYTVSGQPEFVLGKEGKG